MTEKKQLNVLFDEVAIAARVEAIAEQVRDADLKNLLVVAVLKGSFMFAADLLRAMHRMGLQPQVEFVHLSSYLARPCENPEGYRIRRVWP